jgi:hypothetical protein
LLAWKPPAALHLPGDTHDTWVTVMFLPVLRVALPGTSMAVPQVPFFSVTTMGCVLALDAM